MRILKFAHFNERHFWLMRSLNSIKNNRFLLIIYIQVK